MRNKKKSLVHNACSVAVLCSILTLLWLSSCGSFEPCRNNPCDDGVYCNGIESCTIEAGLSFCSEGVPIECEEGMVCNEETRACVAE